MKQPNAEKLAVINEKLKELYELTHELVFETWDDIGDIDYGLVSVMYSLEEDIERVNDNQEYNMSIVKNDHITL